MNFKEKQKQFPYGEEEQDRILTLSEREFMNEINKDYTRLK